MQATTSQDVVQETSSRKATPSLPLLLRRSQRRTAILLDEEESPLGPGVPTHSYINARAYESVKRARVAAKTRSEYNHTRSLPQALRGQADIAQSQVPSDSNVQRDKQPNSHKDAVQVYQHTPRTSKGDTLLSKELIRKKEAAARVAKPTHHLEWKLARVISGHIGWIRSIVVEPDNKWFATGGGDQTIKVWDLVSGQLKLTLTGHVAGIRALAVSDRHPYLFSAGEDKLVKCWDLETNAVVRQYQGHLSGVYSLALHPTLNVLVSGGRDSVARVWDMRTKSQIHVLTGHKSTVSSLLCQEADPQIISGSMDATVRLWDLAAGKSITALTHHKKSVRSMALHPTQFTFATGSAGREHNIKTWQCPEATLLNNLTHENSIVNTVSVNADGVLFSGADDGSVRFFDYDTGTAFQRGQDIAQPGSLNVEAGIFCSTFDQTGTRLFTGGADKTVKVYKETTSVVH